MNIKKVMLISIFLLVFITINAVNAEDNATLNDSILQTTDEDIPDAIMSDNTQTLRENPECVLQSSDNEIIKGNSSQDINSDSSKSAGSENFTITFYDDYYIYGETNLFGFLMPKDIENDVSIEIDAKPYGYEIYDVDNPDLWVWGGDSQTQRGYMVKFSDLYPGSHEVAISYSGDGKYTESRLEKIITVNDDANFHTFSQIQNVIDSVEENSTVILNGTYIGFGEEIIIRKNITLLGVGKNNVLDANSTSRILNITSGSVTLRNLKFINAKNIVNCGGAVYAAGELIVDNCTFKENVVCLDVESRLTVEEIYDKQVSGEMDIKARGGAIYCESNLTVMNSIFYGNDAKSNEVWREMDYYGWQDSAGATTIYVKENMILDNTTITKYGYGGTCDVEAGGNLEIYGCQFNGARTNCGRSVTVNNSEFYGGSTLKSYCNEEYYGDNTSCTLSNSIFKNSHETILWVAADSVVIENNTFIDNDVTYAQSYGFIFLSGDYVEVSGNNFLNNSIRSLDIMQISRTYCMLNIFNNVFKDNRAVGSSYYTHCSIISMEGCNASIIQCSFTNNSGPTAGVIFSSKSNITVEDSNFTNNSPAAIELQKSTIKVNGNDYGYYFKGLLNDSVDGVEDINDLVKFTIEFYDYYYIYNETSFFGFVMPKGVVKSALVTIDGKKYDYDLSYIDDSDDWMWDGDAETQYGHKVQFSDLSVGTHEVVIIYPGDYWYSEIRLVRNITVHDGQYEHICENFTIEFYDDYHIYGETNIFGFLMPKNIENNVSVLIDGKSYDYMVYDITPDQWVWGGDAKTQMGYMVKFSDLSPGDHEVIIAYPGDSRYGESRLVKNITVVSEEDLTVKENFTITFYDDYHIYGETNLFGFLMPKDIENNVSVEIDAKPYGYEIYDVGNPDLWVWGGDAQTQRGYMVKFSDLSLGDHEVIITYPGDSHYGESRLVKNITVHEEIDYSDKEFFQITYFTDEDANILGFLMPKDIANKASVQIDSKDYEYVKCDINNPNQWKWEGDSQTQQAYIVKFSGLEPRSYFGSIWYPGDDKYAESARIILITVNSNVDHDYKLLSKLTASNLNTYYKSGKSFVATLKDENGNPITNAEIKIKFNGQNRILKTDDKGQIRITTNNLLPKSYDVSITYLGNDYFTKSAAKAKITIKKIVSKITASKKTFKKSLKIKKYTVTLKANNKALKNAKLYLKIKGKTYTAKTNKNGKATFKITKLTKKGTFKATVKYAGSKYYSAKTVNTKITCK